MVSVVGVLRLAQRSASELHRYRSADPGVWESAISALELSANENPPPPEAVLFIGTSTIRFWSTLAADVAPLVAVGRGFGGAKLDDVLFYAERLVAPRPRAIVLAVGGNDLFEIAIRPPILDPEGRDPSSQANALIRGFAESREGIEYIDANAAMYGPDKRLREEFMSWDRSQLTREGYRAWSAPIRDRLLRDLGEA